jgi:hypothetical protein
MNKVVGTKKKTKRNVSVWYAGAKQQLPSQ